MENTASTAERPFDGAELAFDALTAFLASAPATYDRAVNQVLARLGEGFGLSTAFACFTGSATLIDARYEWLAPGAQSLGSLSLSAMPSWAKAFAAGDRSFIADIASLPDTGVEKQLLEAKRIAALLVVPLRDGAEVVGLLGLATGSSPAPFSAAEVRVVETLAAAMTALSPRIGRDEGADRARACLEATLKAVPDLVLELDAAGRFVKYHVGRTVDYLPIAEGLLGRMPEEAFPPAGAVIARAVIADVDTKGTSEGRSFYYDLPSGRHWYQISAAAHEHGGYVLVVQDITDHRMRLHDLEWLSDVARRTNNLVIVSDPLGRIDWVNPAFETSTGWTLDEVRGRTPGSFLQCERTDPATVEQIGRLLRDKKPVLAEILNRNRSGEEYWLKLEIQPRFDRKGRHLGFIAVETNVTEIITARSAASRAEQRAEASRQQLVSAVEALRDGFILFDAQDQMVLANTRQHALYPQTSPTMVEGAYFQDILRRGLALGEIVVPPGLEEAVMLKRRVGQTFSDRILQLDDGRVLRVHETSTSDGGRVGLTSDITELTLSQKRLQAIVEGASVGTWEWNIATGQNEINDRWAEIIGYRVDDVPMEINEFYALCHPDDIAMMAAGRNEVLSGHKQQFDLRFRMRHKDGHWVWVLSRGRVLRWEADGKPLLMCGIHMDISELVEAGERAEAANAAKSAFLATMSHEIRTPLNGVLGMADMLAQTALHDDQRVMVDTIRESGWSLLAVLDDILDLSRLEAGKLELESKRFDLPLLLGRLESLHSAAAHAKTLGFKVVLDGDARERIGDPTRITQIVQNLIGNAIKFTAAGQVHLAVHAGHPDHVDFCVTDTGIGMTEAQVARIFEEFQQADSGIARRYGGSGLGLAIVRRLVDQMGGTISVRSVAGEGTVVALRLPLPAAAGEPDTDIRSDPGTEPTRAQDLVGLKVLVAEDNVTNRLIMKIMLGKMGVNAQFAEDGAQAVALWREQPFDLMILDISMPVLDGIQALETMQRDAQSRGEPPPRAIAATANIMKEHIEAYQKVGFMDTIPKPIRFETLVDVLARNRQHADLVAAEDPHSGQY